MSEQRLLRDRAIDAYRKSELWQGDQHSRKNEQAALRAILNDLKSDEQPQGSIVEIEGITLTAHYEPTGIGTLVQSDPLDDVFIQAHEKCSLCGEMIHSDRFSNLFGYAAELGRWLSATHNCPPNSSRTIGFERPT